MSAITTRGLTATAGGATLLDGIDLDVDRGEWLSIVGPNGAGKSTLLRAIAGVGDATGEIAILGRPLRKYSRREAARTIAWVPQTPSIPPGIRVLEYVLLGRTPHLHPLASERAHDLAVVHEVLARLDLVSLAARSVETLSGGERQRVVIGRALAQEAPIILLDEPTTALDLGHQQEVLMLLDQLRGDGAHTIVTTMHDLTLAGLFADGLMLLAAGSVVARGSARSVLTEDNLRTHYRADVQVRDDGENVIVVPVVQRLQSHTPEHDIAN